MSKFGEFLIDKKVIDSETLVEALHLQNKRNVMQLGETAIKVGAIDADQLLEILSVQETIDERFEEVALLMGYLTQDMIDDLRDTQERDQQYIGEILVALNKLNAFELPALLEEYETIRVK